MQGELFIHFYSAMCMHFPHSLASLLVNTVTLLHLIANQLSNAHLEKENFNWTTCYR